MYLYFEDSRGNYRFVGEAIPDNAGSMINDYVHQLNPNYKIYYIRSWIDETGYTYDVGSHTEFFHLVYEKLET